jgi:lambda family phage tail tape measure protein
MATTIDKVTVQAEVTGSDQLKGLDDRLKSIDDSSKKTAEAMKQVQGGVRNTAYQIQDLAVQIAGGTNAFVALGQQIPQLLSAFGTTGVVIGAIAAVAIPALQAGLKAAGIDMRNLKEMTDDLAKSNEAYLASQKQNQTTIQGLGNSYGSLTDEAKQFFEVKQKLDQSKAQRDSIDVVNELKDSYSKLSEESVKAARENARFTPMAGAAAADLGIAFQQFRKGLTEQQGFEVAKMMKDIDANSPEKTVRAINDILKYLGEIGPEADKFKQSFEKSVDPLMKINEELIKNKLNIKEAAEQATKFATELTGIQNKYAPDIGAAKRNFDQVTAIGLEGKMKLAEFDRQMEEKNKDGVERAAEAASGRLRIQQEMSDKVKDFNKAQQETFFSAQLTNEAKESQLRLQGKINTLQMGQIEAINYQSIAEESALKNINDQQQALIAIDELRRKNLITEDRADRLREQASNIRKLADSNAQQDAEKLALTNARNIRIQVEGLALQNEERLKSLNLEMTSFTMSTNAQIAKKKELDLENTRNKSIMDINNNSRLSDAEKLTAIAKINEESNVTLEILKSEAAYREKIDASFKMGGYDRAKQISEGFSNFKTAGMAVDAVWGQMSSSIDKFVETGKLSFSDFARSVIYDLEKIALKSAVIGVFKSMGLADLFSLPGKATGGPVSGDTAYMVGEQGPELFIPTNAGKIIPNNQLRGGGGQGGGNTIINNISAIDAKSVAQLFAENRMTLFGTVEQARRELPMRTR